MARLESKFRTPLAALLRSQGAMVFSLLPPIPGEHDMRQYSAQPGWPDLLVVHRMWTGLIETKGHETRVSEEQRQILPRIATRWPLHVVVVRDMFDHRVQVTWWGEAGELTDPEPWQCMDSELLKLLKEVVR
jgi:hypothetical protein